MAAKTDKTPVQMRLADGSLFTCSCGINEFRVAGDPPHFFCRCGKVYTSRDLPPLEGS